VQIRPDLIHLAWLTMDVDLLVLNYGLWLQKKPACCGRFCPEPAHGSPARLSESRSISNQRGTKRHGPVQTHSRPSGQAHAL